MSRLPSSYRDPSGFIFKENDLLKRQVNPIFFDEYKAVKDAGIYELLAKKGWLIPHQELSSDSQKIILQPEQIPFISYPYEWSFTQYKHAAQLTLRIQMFLLEHGFSLKDASAFNITFHKGAPVFIDTLSIEHYKENKPWRALQQFEMHFFSVLLLAQKFGSQHLKTLASEINGKDLQQTARLLGWKSRFHPVIYPNIHLMAKTSEGSNAKIELSKEPVLSKNAQLKILKVLESHIAGMEMKESTEWTAYYHQTNYNQEAFELKKSTIKEWVSQLNATKVVDLGGNDGTFANSLDKNKTSTIVCDIDQAAIDHCYLQQINEGASHILPLVLDLMQPSPAIGFGNEERESFVDRIKAFGPKVSMALALIHHITLTGNVPFEMSAAFFRSLSEYLIIEFPDREDSWVEYILDSKRDARHLFDDYNLSAFAKAYSQYFHIEKEVPLKNTHRTMFLMRRK